MNTHVVLFLVDVLRAVHKRLIILSLHCRISRELEALHWLEQNLTGNQSSFQQFLGTAYTNSTLLEIMSVINAASLSTNIGNRSVIELKETNRNYFRMKTNRKLKNFQQFHWERHVNILFVNTKHTFYYFHTHPLHTPQIGTRVTGNRNKNIQQFHTQTQTDNVLVNKQYTIRLGPRRLNI